VRAAGAGANLCVQMHANCKKLLYNVTCLVYITAREKSVLINGVTNSCR